MTVTMEVLRSELSAGTEETFLEAYDWYCNRHGEQELHEDDRKQLLSAAVHRGMLQAAKKLLASQLKDGKFHGSPKLLSGLLAICCQLGTVGTLEWLLEIIPANWAPLVNEDALLALLVKQIDVYKDKNKCPFFRSMILLLDDPRTEVDKTDARQCTALHYAVKFNVDHAQELLLAKGAYVGGQDRSGDVPIGGINTLLLEQHLNTCVSDNGRKPADEEYELKISFSNFVPPTHKPNASVPWERSAHALPHDDEMLPIVRMAQSIEHKRLLRHPVIASILQRKWCKLRMFFYLNLLIYSIFSVSLVCYVVFCHGREDSPLRRLLHGLSLVGLVYLILRELTQFLLNMRVYVRSVENYMELLLIFAARTVLLHEAGSKTPRVATACVILLSAVGFTLLIGTLPLLSTYMVMLKTVSKNFLKCLVPYSIILLAFALSFHLLFQERTASESPGRGMPGDVQFNRFDNIPLALMKTVVMFTGEFEAASIKFQKSGLSYIVFALFLFFVSIVLFNLMNGLAISDTTIIKAESELVGIIHQVFIIHKYENVLKTSNPIRSILQLLPNLVPLEYVASKTYRYDPMMLIPSLLEHPATKETKKRNEELGIKSETKTLLPGSDKLWNECCSMPYRGCTVDGKIVKNALDILHLRQANVGSIDYRVSRIEQSIDRMLQDLIELRMLMRSVSEALQNAKP